MLGMDGNAKRYPPLSTKKIVSSDARGSLRKPDNVARKSKEAPYKAKAKVSSKGKSSRATSSRAKCMEGSKPLSGYFPKSQDESMGVSSPVVLSSDDGSPTPTQRDREARKAEAKRFVCVEAECSTGSEDERGPLTLDLTEEVDATMGGFVVSDGHLSQDEGDSDDWLGVNRAWRIGREPSDSPPVTPLRSKPVREKEAEKERESSVETSVFEGSVEWEVGAQPESPISPVRLDDASLEEDHQDVEVEMEMPGDEVLEDTGSRFRLNNQFLLLTYKSHLPKAAYIKWLKEECERPDAWVRVAHETADKKNPYRHTHVVIDFGRRVNTRDCHKFCYKNPDDPRVDKCGRIHCHIRRLLGVKAFEDAKVYIGKEDPDNKDLRVAKDKGLLKGAALVESIQRAPTVNAALRNNLRRIGDAAGIIQIYDFRMSAPVDLYVPSRPVQPWAVELLDAVELNKCPFGDRKIIWYCDHVGGAGKTSLARYLDRLYAGENGFDWFVMSAVNEYNQAAHQVAEAMKSGFRFKGFIFECPRGFTHKQGLYQILESFKDGKITSTKYQGRNIMFNTPWVIVMANFWPKANMVSLDRWDIRRIDAQTGVAEHLPHDAEQAPHFRHCDSCTCQQNQGAHHSGGRHDILQERL